jgi:AraC-like DNA-binding protein
MSFISDTAPASTTMAKGPRIGRNGLRAARKITVLNAMDGLLGERDLSARLVATSLGVSARYIHILLKDTGLTFAQHLIEKRLTQVAAQLRDRDCGLRISDIAAAAGFGDLSHFNRNFRRRFGTTPGRMRKSAVSDA